MAFIAVGNRIHAAHEQEQLTVIADVETWRCVEGVLLQPSAPRALLADAKEQCSVLPR